MEEQSRSQRLTNLRKLGKVLNAWHFVYAIIFITFLPYLAKGTSIHEHVVTFSRYGTIGILLAPFYVKLINIILEWYVKTGRNLESQTFIPMLAAGGLIGASISYIILRIFKHEGDWDVTLSISYQDVMAVLFSNIILALFSGFAKSITIYYRQGENIILRSEKPTPFWKFVVTLFSIPLFVLLIFSCSILIRYLAN